MKTGDSQAATHAKNKGCWSPVKKNVLFEVLQLAYG